MADETPALSPVQEDAYQTILATLRQYGLETLAPQVLSMVQNGYASSQINLMIQDTTEYKERFKANLKRREKGLAVLSPAEYLATERAYREVMSSAGLPVGFYDQADDFTAWLSDDVSPTEIQGRVQVASDLINNLDQGVLDVFHQWYSDGELVAYALDRERAVPVIERQYRAAQVAGYTRNAGANITQGTAEQIGALGLDEGQARSGAAQVARAADIGKNLSGIFGGSYSADDAAKDVFLQDQAAGAQRRSLASQERAAFTGSAGVNKTSLGRRQAGQV